MALKEWDSLGSEDDEPQSNAPVILGIVIILVILMAGYLVYEFVILPKQREEQRLKQTEQISKPTIIQPVFIEPGKGECDSVVVLHYKTKCK